MPMYIVLNSNDIIIINMKAGQGRTKEMGRKNEYNINGLKTD